MCSSKAGISTRGLLSTSVFGRTTTADMVPPSKKEGGLYSTEEVPENIDDSAENGNFRKPCGESPAVSPSPVFYEVKKTKLRPSIAISPVDFEESG